MKAGIVMPARNEVNSIGLVLDEIPMEQVAEVIVVDNGSSDATAEVAKRHGARVVEEPQPGYGIACLRGIGALGDEADIVVILDADHSDYPEDLGMILAPIIDGRADFVIGSRVAGSPEKGSLQWNQRFGNALACSLIRWLYGVAFTDMGPFRAIRRAALADLELSDPDYGWNAEMQVKAIIQRLSIEEVPVRYRKRIGRSKISGTVKGTILAGIKIIGTILRYYPRYSRLEKKA